MAEASAAQEGAEAGARERRPPLACPPPTFSVAPSEALCWKDPDSVLSLP